MTEQKQIPEIGFLRLREVLHVYPVSESTWWAGVASGRFPKPVKLARRIAAWRVEDIRNLIGAATSQASVLMSTSKVEPLLPATAIPTSAPNLVSIAFARQRAAMAVLGASPPEKHVLLVLSAMANTVGQCWPPIRGPHGLAAKTALGVRTVVRALRGLETAGHISTQYVVGKGSVYTVIGCQSGSPVALTGVSEGQSTPAALTSKQPRATIERKKASPSSSARALPFDAMDLIEQLPPGTDRSAWAGYVELRQALAKGPRAKPWTRSVATAALNMLTQLRTAGHAPTAVLEQSTLNSWAGLFPLKDRQNVLQHDQVEKSDRPNYYRTRPVDGFTQALREVSGASNSGSYHER